MYNNMFFLGVNAMLNWLFIYGGPLQHVPGPEPACLENVELVHVS